MYNIKKSIKIQNFVRRHFVLNYVAECCLTLITLIRGGIGRGYASGGEDIMISHLLKDIYNKEIDQIRYLDCGAYHWCRGSNSYYFYRKGAKGILVEANPILCKKLEKRRERDIIVNAAVDVQSKEKTIPFYVLFLTTRSSIDEKNIAETVKMGAAVREIIQVPCFCINDLLERYYFQPDVLTMDLEGMDYKVLRSLNLEKYKIKVIIVEVANDISDSPESMEEYMLKKGYCVHARVGSNIIFRLL